MSPHLTVAAEQRFFQGASVRSQALGAGIRYGARPVLDVWSRLPFLFFPPNALDHVARLASVPEGTRWRPFDLGDVPCEWIQGPGVDDRVEDGAMLYFHGGAFLTCGLNTHRRLVARLSGASRRPVLNVGYRQLPVAPVAQSIQDGVDAFMWLLESGYRPEDITIAGDSAGGYVAFSVARAVMDSGLGRPAGIVALSPLLDLDPTLRADHRNVDRCQAFPHRAVSRLADAIAHIDIKHGVHGQRTCPINMPLADMPPTLIHVGSREILMADAEAMANRLAAAGVPCELHVWDRQVHVFQAAASWVPEARAAIDEIGAFVRQLPQQQAAFRPRRIPSPVAAVRRVIDTALG